MLCNVPGDWVNGLKKSARKHLQGRLMKFPFGKMQKGTNTHSLNYYKGTSWGKKRKRAVQYFNQTHEELFQTVQVCMLHS